MPTGWRRPRVGGTVCEENLFMKWTLGICYSSVAQGRPESPK